MTIFIQSLDYQLWNIIVNGPKAPSKIVEGVVTPKSENEFDDNDVKLLQLNSNAKHVLFCAVYAVELNVTYERTNQVNEKISMLVHQYELFMMHDDESISDMFPCFTTIINSLKNLGKCYPN
ncbi:LOW QUALITY PROTEIN: UBN2 domain-containing protein, partial [Cephalotus follicularis]